MRVVPAIIIATAIMLASLIFVFVPMFLTPTAGVGPNGGAVDNNARIDLELLRGDLETEKETVSQLRDQVDALEGRINKLEQGPAVAPEGGQVETPTGPNEILDSYAQVVLVADRRELNKGLTVATPAYLTATFGAPADNLGDTCATMTNPRLAAELVTEQVGPVEVKMLKPAIDSLRTVLENIQKADPDLYARINTAGSLCVRLIRGSTNSVSTHAFGLAVDLNVDGVLDTLGDGRTQLGLTIMSSFFNAEGWNWGAAYGREDSMHFEVSKEKIDQWLAEGKI